MRMWIDMHALELSSFLLESKHVAFQILFTKTFSDAQKVVTPYPNWTSTIENQTWIRLQSPSRWSTDPEMILSVKNSNIWN